MKKILMTAIAAALSFTAFSVTAQEMNDTYMRAASKTDSTLQEVAVFTHDGKLYCRRLSDMFEMCYGMEKQANGSYTGKNMRHPMMGKSIAFDGTVVFNADNSLNIKGCQFGGLFCDSEHWTKK